MSALPLDTLPPPPRRLSCGVLVLDAQGELLLCHVTGQARWDLPKGGARPDETPLQAALRETQEETGLQLHDLPLLDLGRLPFRPRKDLHLFAVLLPRIDTATLWCASRFSDAGGQRLPEMDGYGWFAFDQAPTLCGPRLAAVLQQLDLPRLLRRLQAGEAASPAPAATPAAAQAANDDTPQAPAAA